MGLPLPYHPPTHQSIAPPPHQLDLKNNRQSNLDTHGSRVIRRTVESGAAWTCNRCSYHNAPGAGQCVMCEAVRGEAS